MVAKAKTSKTSGKSGTKGKVGGAECLYQLILSRAPSEDLKSYDDAALHRTAEVAAQTVAAHLPGGSVQRVDNETGIERLGRPVTVVTVVNDNMPFLFDSVMGELSDSAGEPSLVLHPVLLVKHEKKGVAEIVGDAASGKLSGDVDKVSLIHVHLPRMSDDECKALEKRLANVLKQVRATVADRKSVV